MSPTLVSFPQHADRNGVLCVYESGEHVPFQIERIFTVSATAGDVRGKHAHKACTQLLVCLSGRIRVACDDGKAVTHHMLEGMNQGLLIPPGLWASEEYLTDGAVMMVLCDRKYEKHDYIRDYDEFRVFAGAAK